MSELQDFQKLVIENAIQAKGLAIGDLAPDFTLPNALGKSITLSQILQSGSVILKFYRGEWCPICNLDLQEVQKHLPQIEALGAIVLAISPQNPDGALAAVQKSNLGFEVLSDSDQQVIEAYQLQFDPGEDYHKRRDLMPLNGNGSKKLPVPATYIINRRGIIEAAHVEANYTKRMGPSDIIAILKVLATKALY